MLISEFLFCFEDDDEKKVLRMVNYSTNISERNNHISPQNIGKKREKNPQHIMLEIMVLAWESGVNQLIGSQPWIQLILKVKSLIFSTTCILVGWNFSKHLLMNLIITEKEKESNTSNKRRKSITYKEKEETRGKTGNLEMVGWFMVFNATFNNISAISWRSVLWKWYSLLGNKFLY